jgi:hypothetical protein
MYCCTVKTINNAETSMSLEATSIVNGFGRA